MSSTETGNEAAVATPLLLGGIVLLGLGMAAVFLGVVVAALFVPGVVMVGLGLLVVAAAGVWRVWAVTRAESSLPESG